MNMIQSFHETNQWPPGDGEPVRGLVAAAIWACIWGGALLWTLASVAVGFVAGMAWS